jgi:hypothetical protein
LWPENSELGKYQKRDWDDVQEMAFLFRNQGAP